MSSVENLTEYREFPVFLCNSDGKELSLFFSGHCFEKEELNISVHFKFSHEVVLMKSHGIHGTFLGIA